MQIGTTSSPVWWTTPVFDPASTSDNMTRFSIVESVKIVPLLLGEVVVNDVGVLLR